MRVKPNVTVFLALVVMGFFAATKLKLSETSTAAMEEITPDADGQSFSAERRSTVNLIVNEPSDGATPNDNLQAQMTQRKEHIDTGQPSMAGCSAEKHIAMVKIGKTGTTTLCSMFLRVLYLNGLRLLHAVKVEGQIAWKMGRGKGWDISPQGSTHADMILNHVVYNPETFGRYIKPDYKLIVPAREPVSWFKSMVMDSKQWKFSPHGVINNDRLFFEGGGFDRKTHFHIQHLQYLGFDYKQKENVTAIREFIKHFIPTKKNVQKKTPSQPFTEADALKVIDMKHNYGDKLLYDALNTTWWNQAEVKEHDFWKEVEYFKILNHEVPGLCQMVKTTRRPHVIEANAWHGTLELSPEWCTAFSCDHHCKHPTYTCVNQTTTIG